MSRYQKGKTNVDSLQQESEETDNQASTPPIKFFRGRMPFQLPNQQHQSTEGKI